jgi:CubicO group peptidase (beta-lactamase class C family)
MLIIAGITCIILVSGCLSSTVNPAGEERDLNISEAGNGVADINTIILQFDTYASQTFNRSGVPGMAVAVVKNDTVIYQRCFGVKNTTTREPVTPHTRFQLASISKSFTTATIASMAGKGELSWDDPVAPLYPEFRLSDPWVTGHVTFRDLLSHRTGLPEYAGDELQDLEYNRSEIIGRLSQISLSGQFRSSYAYSNIGITLAAETAAKRAGKPWEELISERIFVPAGMMNTSSRYADYFNAPDRADTYPTINGTAAAGELLNDDVNSPAGGVSSTLADMARYLELQMNEGSINGTQIIAADALRETHKPQNIRNASGSTLIAYALGWETTLEKGRYRVEHGGDLTNGVSTYITFYPEEKTGIVVLTNGFPGGHILKKAVTHGWDDLYTTGAVQKDWYGELESFMNEMLKPGASIIGPQVQLPPAPPGSNLSWPLAIYNGSYIQDYYGLTRIENSTTGLMAYLGHNTTPWILSPYEGNTFKELQTGTAVNFTVSSDGTATAVHFVILDKPWCNGTFNRISPGFLT